MSGTLFFLLVAFIPRIGPKPLYKATLWKTVLALISIGLAGILYALHPTQGYLGTWLFTGFLALLSSIIYPSRIFVALRSPKHVDALSADLGGDASILGYEGKGAACAWPMEVLVPRHLIADQVGNTQVLVAY